MRKTSVRQLVATAVLGVFPLMLAAACGNSSSSPKPASSGLEKTNLVVGAVPAETGAAMFIAQEQGIFAKHGLHVTVKSITSTTTIVPDMLSGAVDIASGQLPTFIAAQAKGVGSFHVLASGLTLGPGVNEILALKSSGITSPSQLKGKTLAVNAPTGDSALLTDTVLADAGVSPSQVTHKVIPFTDMGVALSQHEVDAVYCTEPTCSVVKAKDGARVVADTDQGAAQGMLTAGYTATTAWMKKYPKTAAAFTASILEASKIADSNRADLSKALVASLHITSQVASSVAVGTFPTSVSQAKLQQVVNLMVKFGELKGSFNVASLTKS
jgi:NitT/TauT family transport system substrate-binding protein